MAERPLVWARGERSDKESPVMVSPPADEELLSL
jgi:hypothetical protein